MQSENEKSRSGEQHKMEKPTVNMSRHDDEQLYEQVATEFNEVLLLYPYEGIRIKRGCCILNGELNNLSRRLNKLMMRWRLIKHKVSKEEQNFPRVNSTDEAIKDSKGSSKGFEWGKIMQGFCGSLRLLVWRF